MLRDWGQVYTLDKKQRLRGIINKTNKKKGEENLAPSFFTIVLFRTKFSY